MEAAFIVFEQATGEDAIGSKNILNIRKLY
jgi:hypothetical protein